MSKRKNVLHHICFWCVIVLAVTAEGWMDMLCHVIFRA